MLVTGGLGFIGSNFIRKLLTETEYDIVNLDKITYAANPESLADIEENTKYIFVKGDIGDKNLVRDLMKDIDVVVNFAAESHVDRSLQDYSPFIETNINGTVNLLQEANEANVKKFVHISTDEVYGQTMDGTFTEEDKLHPRNPYSASKAGAEMFVSAFNETYGLPTIITRSSNNYGPYQFPEKMMPVFVTNLIEGKKVPLYGEGLQIREWTYVEDNCDGLLVAIEKGKTGDVYNVSAGNELPNVEMTHKILEKMGVGEDMIQKVEDRRGHDFRYSIDSSKIRNLGWEPKHTLDEGMDITIKWYKENKLWWEPLKRKLGK